MRYFPKYLPLTEYSVMGGENQLARTCEKLKSITWNQGERNILRTAERRKAQ